LRLGTWLAVIPVAALTIWFALANRSLVTFSLDPFNLDEPQWAVRLPLFIVVFIGIFLGMLAGGAIVWWGQGRWRREARRRAKEVDRLTRTMPEGSSQ
jgi:uncharacterized integral membrane protein